MSDTDKKIDENKGDDVLKRMLKTKPKPENAKKTSSTDKVKRESDENSTS